MTDCDQYPIAVAYTAKDVKKSIQFYTETLGFELEKSWPENDPVWANLLMNKQSIMLGASMSPEVMKEYGCGEDKLEFIRKDYETYQKTKAGVGVNIYVMVPDVDAFYKTVKSKGARVLNEPTTQFYGQRDFIVEDPDGYRLTFYTAVQLKECQSCGMPLQNAQAGQMFCQYCADAKGNLKSYETIFEGTVTGYFMGMQKMSRPDAEKAARAHLSKMPAWKGKH